MDHVTPAYPESVHAAFQALLSAMGPSTKRAVEHQEAGMHPVFGLLRHGLGGDNYVAWHVSQDSYRGDVLTVPFWSESGPDGVLEIGFHKGDTSTWVVEFPEAPEPIAAAFSELLQKCETR